jgi:hypothetical protein
VLDTAHRLTAPVRHPRIWLEHPEPGVLHVVGLSETGTATYSEQVPIGGVTGPVPRMLLDPDLLRDAVAFCDGDTVTVQAIADRLPTYLAGARRHAIVKRIAG